MATALYPIASAESLAAWAALITALLTLPLAIVGVYSLRATAKAAKAAADAAQISAAQLKLEANPLIVISRYAFKPPRLDHEFIINSQPDGRLNVTEFTATDANGRRVESTTLPGFLVYLQVENAGRSPAVFPLLTLFLKDQSAGEAERTEAAIGIDSLASGATLYVSIENASQLRAVLASFAHTARLTLSGLKTREVDVIAEPPSFMVTNFDIVRKTLPPPTSP